MSEKKPMSTRCPQSVSRETVRLYVNIPVQVFAKIFTFRPMMN